MTFLSMQNVVKSFGKMRAIDHLSLKIHSGEVLALLGPSGCGKSTALRLLAGFETPNSGSIEMDGKTLATGTRSLAPEHRDMGVVFQSYALWPHMNVYRHVEFGLKSKNKNTRNPRDKVMTSLEMVRLTGYEKRYPHELSGGQQQRVALARALVTSPKMLLLDEPLSNLDSLLRDHMRFEIKQLQRSLGVAMLYVTHDQTEALSLADRIAVLNAGAIEQIGTPNEIYERPATKYVAEALGATNLLTGKVTRPGTSKVEVLVDERIVIEAAVPDAHQAPASGSMMKLSVRPTDLILQDHSETSAPNMRARVVESFFFGDRMEYMILPAEGKDTLRVTRHPTEKRYEVGDTVGVSVRPDTAVALKTAAAD